jgi:hypothetical protein
MNAPNMVSWMLQKKLYCPAVAAVNVCTVVQGPVQVSCFVLKALKPRLCGTPVSLFLNVTVTDAPAFTRMKAVSNSRSSAVTVTDVAPPGAGLDTAVRVATAAVLGAVVAVAAGATVGGTAVAAAVAAAAGVLAAGLLVLAEAEAELDADADADAAADGEPPVAAVAEPVPPLLADVDDGDASWLLFSDDPPQAAQSVRAATAIAAKSKRLIGEFYDGGWFGDLWAKPPYP